MDLDERSGEPRGIYGTTTHGGYYGIPWCSRLGGCGTLFKIAGETKETLLKFGLDVVGNFPMGNLLALEANAHRPFTVLGTASDAFFVGGGTVYRYSAGHPQVLWDAADWPLAGLTKGPGARSMEPEAA